MLSEFLFPESPTIRLNGIECMANRLSSGICLQPSYAKPKPIPTKTFHK